MAEWRVGRHYPVHVYEGDTPVATFFTAEDARLAVMAVNSARSGNGWYQCAHGSGLGRCPECGAGVGDG